MLFGCNENESTWPPSYREWKVNLCQLINAFANCLFVYSDVLLMGWISMERFNDNGAAKVNLFRIWRWHVFIHTLIKFGLFLDPHQCASMAQMHYARQALERMEHFFIWKNSYIMLLRGLFVVKFRFSCHFNWIEERAWIRLLFSVSPVTSDQHISQISKRTVCFQ